MPAGYGPLGFVYFAGVKFAGYYGYSELLNRSKAIQRAGSKIPEAWKGGLARTGVGVVVGAIAGLAFWKLIPNGSFMDHYGSWVFFGGLLPVRVAEWSFFLWLLYRQFKLDTITLEKFIFLGVLVSFLLDAIGLFAAFVMPGGAWIC